MGIDIKTASVEAIKSHADKTFSELKDAVLKEVAKTPTPEATQQLTELVKSLEVSMERIAKTLEKIAEQTAPKKAPPPSFAQKYHLRKIALAAAAAIVICSYPQAVQDLFKNAINFSGAFFQTAREVPSVVNTVRDATGVAYSGAYWIGKPIAMARNVANLVVDTAPPVTTEQGVAGLAVAFSFHSWVTNKVKSIATPVFSYGSQAVAPLGNLLSPAWATAVSVSSSLAAPIVSRMPQVVVTAATVGTGLLSKTAQQATPWVRPGLQTAFALYPLYRTILG